MSSRGGGWRSRRAARSSLTSSGHRPKQKFAWIAVVGVVAFVVAIVLFSDSTSSDSPVGLASSYHMAFDNLSFNIRTTGTLTAVSVDRQGLLRGQMTVLPPLYGTGAVKGAVKRRTVDFVGAYGSRLTGVVNAQGVIKGTYTIVSQHGTWQATPTGRRPSATSAGGHWWLWLLVLALLVAASGCFVVRRVRRHSRGTRRHR